MFSKNSTEVLSCQGKKSLIWYISFGGYESKEQTKLSVMSLMEWGKFTGDIIILSDQPGMNDSLEKKYSNIRVIDISVFIKNKIPKFDFFNKFNIYCLKPLIYHFTDLQKYKFAFYFDSDILIPNDKINLLMDYYRSIGKIQIQHNGEWTIAKNKPSTGADVLSQEEKRMNWSLSLCAGVVGIPCNDTGLGFLIEWDRKNQEGDYILDDQGNLYWVIINKFAGMWEYCDSVCRAEWTMNRPICHYGGSRAKNMFWEHSKLLFKDFIPTNDSKKILGKWHHSKPSEQINNIWDFRETHFVYVSEPDILGMWMETEEHIVVWWTSGGFEKIQKPISNSCIGASYRGGLNSFSLSKL